MTIGGHKTLLPGAAALLVGAAFVAPVIGVNGGSCTTPPPAVAPDGRAYLVYANIWLRASGWAFFGRLDLETVAYQTGGASVSEAV